MPLTLETVPCLSDNYAYLLHDPESGATAVVDVPDAAPILRALQARQWTLTDIFITHHHNDHIAGVDSLRAETGARVTGAKSDRRRLPNLDHAVEPGEQFAFADETVDVIDVSGHTVGHIAYHLPESAMVFTGDSLMALGCGRLFEGTPDQMWESLQRLAKLPDDTLVCSGHEYTLTNARFAKSIDADNLALDDRITTITTLRDSDKPTVPSMLGEEKATNPFMRADDSSLKAALGLENTPDAEVFAQIRRMKDTF